MKKSVLTFIVFVFTGVFISSNASERWLSSYKQKVIYEDHTVNAEIGITKDGIEVKYSTSGSNVIGVKGYCGFAFDTCDPQKSNYIILLNDKRTVR